MAVEKKRRAAAGVPDGGAEFPPVEARISFLAHQINARIAQVSNQLFRRHDIDVYSSRILVILLEQREVRIGRLVETMVLPQSTISHQIQRLEKRGLVRRRRTREDNRAVAVTLTPKGVAIAQECNGLSRAVYGAMTETFTPGEIEELRAKLRKLFAALTAFGEAQTAAAAPAP